MNQKQVDEHFNAESAFWRDAYQREDVLGTVFNQRKMVALKYIEELFLPKSSSVLEIGCGAGYMAVALARMGFTVKAVDHASSMIELTNICAKQKGLENRIHATIEDAHNLTFGGCAFDLIVALGVVDWLHDLRKGLHEISRVLKPGGYLVLSMENPYRWWRDPPLFIQGVVKKFLQRIRLLEWSYGAHAQYYSIKQIEHNLSNLGLNPIKKSNLGFGPFSLFNHRLFSDRVGIKINNVLQGYSTKGCSILRRAGGTYVILAQKE
jgi:ubiquinone/menaquinone biosynthesis C-methylase UbiE